jgi:hypothetical protein
MGGTLASVSHAHAHKKVVGQQMFVLASWFACSCFLVRLNCAPLDPDDCIAPTVALSQFCLLVLRAGEELNSQCMQQQIVTQCCWLLYWISINRLPGVRTVRTLV